MYLTASEYASLTGRSSTEATSIRINIACRLLDSRIGNYGTYNTGWKINNSSSTWYVNFSTALTADQKEAIKLWIAGMITYLFLNDNNISSPAKNIKLGRFSVGKTNASTSKLLPDEMNQFDIILVSSGIINRGIGIK
jgi:hypothetical protein